MFHLLISGPRALRSLGPSHWPDHRLGQHARFHSPADQSSSRSYPVCQSAFCAAPSAFPGACARFKPCASLLTLKFSLVITARIGIDVIHGPDPTLPCMPRSAVATPETKPLSLRSKSTTAREGGWPFMGILGPSVSQCLLG